ncbi:hypothetical protein M405DRAFT_804980, partial [Rhizopogon salebrosus TDB-379]
MACDYLRSAASVFSPSLRVKVKLWYLMRKLDYALRIVVSIQYSITLCAGVRGRSGNLAEGVRGRQRRVHPSYIRYGFCQDDGDYPYIVSPWVLNENLIDYFKRHPEVDHRYMLKHIAEVTSRG